VTLTGPGGAGKTRLALALAQQLLTGSPDGAFFVGLEDARDRTTVAATIALALGVRERPRRDFEQGVKEHLRERELLLVLDNFEQVLSAAPLVAELLSGSPRLRVLVTSRASLHLSGEQDFEVPPLRLPDPRHLPSLSALSQFEAVALFIERASAAKADFAVTNDNAPAVAEICSRLDGLPLAIELAAARIRFLGPQAILDRLERRLPVLGTGGQDLPARQRTLRGAIDWSYELLDEPERRLFERLSVFAGGFTLGAAEEVCDPNAELGIGPLDGLASLVDKSLIHPVDGIDEEPRFAMLQVIREFASEKLEARAETDDVRRRHAHHVLRLAEASETRLLSVEHDRWLRRITVEEENVRGALRWSIDRDEADAGLRTAAALWRFWHIRGELREGRRWLESLLALPSAAADTLARGKALNALGGLAYWQGEIEGARATYDEAVSIFRRLGDEKMLGLSLRSLAWTFLGRGDLAHADAPMREALDHLERAGDRPEASATRVLIAIAEGFATRDFGPGIRATIEAIEAFRDAGRTYDAADMVAQQAFAYWMADDPPKALESGRQALREFYEMRYLGRIPSALKAQANQHLMLGRPDRAVRLAAASARLAEGLGGDIPDALVLGPDAIDQSRDLMSREEHARGIEEGRAMTLEEAIAYAMEDDVPGGGAGGDISGGGTSGGGTRGGGTRDAGPGRRSGDEGAAGAEAAG
jgi:predicted ATPase